MIRWCRSRQDRDVWTNAHIKAIELHFFCRRHAQCYIARQRSVCWCRCSCCGVFACLEVFLGALCTMKTSWFNLFTWPFSVNTITVPLSLSQDDQSPFLSHRWEVGWGFQTFWPKWGSACTHDRNWQKQQKGLTDITEGRNSNAGVPTGGSTTSNLAFNQSQHARHVGCVWFGSLGMLVGWFINSVID